MVQIVRDWIDAHTDPSTLGALRDPQIGRVISAIQTRPEEGWTVAGIAKVAGMSRTSFAIRFRERVGLTPMRYVTEWRMRVARMLLRDPSIGIAEISERVGYGSQAAFAKAFRECDGLPPGKFRHMITQADAGAGSDRP